MKEVRPTSLLKDRVREVEGNPDFSNQDIGGSQPQVITEIRTGIMSSSNEVGLQHEIVNSSQSLGHLNPLSQVCNSLYFHAYSLSFDSTFCCVE